MTTVLSQSYHASLRQEGGLHNGDQESLGRAVETSCGRVKVAVACERQDQLLQVNQTAVRPYHCFESFGPVLNTFDSP